LLSCLRGRFWILGGRRFWQKLIAKCMTCKRHKALNVEVDPGVLPEDRIKDALVFEVSGVNLAGRLILIGGQKAYAVYRAVHLS